MSEQLYTGLDKLFQRASTKHNFTYDAAAWAQMEELLDKQKRKRRFFWWFWGILLSLGCFLIFTFFFRLGQITNDQPEVRKEMAETLGTGVPKYQPETLSRRPSNNIETSKKWLRIDEVEISKRREKTAKKSPEGLQKHHLSKGKWEKKRSLSHPLPPLQKIKLIEISPRKLQNKPLLLTDPSGVGHTIIHLNEAIQAWKDTPLLAVPRITISPSYKTPQDTMSVRLGNRVQVRRSGAPVNKTEWILGLVVAAEGAGISGRNLNHMNGKAGLQLEYRYAGRFSIRTGINVTRKSYTAEEGDYIPPKGFWTRRIAPQITNGICTVLELPVLLGYYPTGYQKAGFYSEVGISSLLLLREQYQYFYDLPDPDLIRSWGTKNSNRHWLDIAQLSLGYQQSIRSKLSWALGSYIQLPMGGMGHGKVRLWHVGLTFRINLQVH